jgi:hypothetical protein
MNGAVIGELREGDREIKLVTRLRADERSQLSDIQDLYVTSLSGTQKVPLRQVSKIAYSFKTEKIRRRNQFRTITVSAFPAPGWLTTEVLAKALPEVEKLSFATVITLLLVPVLYTIFVRDLHVLRWERPAERYSMDHIGAPPPRVEYPTVQAPPQPPRAGEIVAPIPSVARHKPPTAPPPIPQRQLPTTSFDDDAAPTNVYDPDRHDKRRK